jgi:ribosomal protein L44E
MSTQHQSNNYGTNFPKLEYSVVTGSKNLQAWKREYLPNAIRANKMTAPFAGSVATGLMVAAWTEPFIIPAIEPVGLAKERLKIEMARHMRTQDDFRNAKATMVSIIVEMCSNESILRLKDVDSSRYLRLLNEEDPFGLLTFISDTHSFIGAQRNRDDMDKVKIALMTFEYCPGESLANVKERINYIRDQMMALNMVEANDQGSMVFAVLKALSRHPASVINNYCQIMQSTEVGAEYPNHINYLFTLLQPMEDAWKRSLVAPGQVLVAQQEQQAAIATAYAANNKSRIESNDFDPHQDRRKSSKQAANKTSTRPIGKYTFDAKQYKDKNPASYDHLKKMHQKEPDKPLHQLMLSIRCTKCQGRKHVAADCRKTYNENTANVAEHLNFDDILEQAFAADPTLMSDDEQQDAEDEEDQIFDSVDEFALTAAEIIAEPVCNSPTEFALAAMEQTSPSLFAPDHPAASPINEVRMNYWQYLHNCDSHA